MQLADNTARNLIIEMAAHGGQRVSDVAKALALAGMAVAGYHSNFPACE